MEVAPGLVEVAPGLVEVAPGLVGLESQHKAWRQGVIADLRPVGLVYHGFS